MTRFTLHVGDVVSLTSENPEIPHFAPLGAGFELVWKLIFGAGLVVFDLVCGVPGVTGVTVHQASWLQSINF